MAQPATVPRVSKRARSAPTPRLVAEEEAKKPRALKAAPTSLKAKQATTKAKAKKAPKKTTATKVKVKATAKVRAAKQVRRSHWTCG
jgi:hypothetical protein